MMGYLPAFLLTSMISLIGLIMLMIGSISSSNWMFTLWSVVSLAFPVSWNSDILESIFRLPGQGQPKLSSHPEPGSLFSDLLRKPSLGIHGNDLMIDIWNIFLPLFYHLRIEMLIWDPVVLLSLWIHGCCSRVYVCNHSGNHHCQSTQIFHTRDGIHFSFFIFLWFCQTGLLEHSKCPLTYGYRILPVSDG